MSPEHWELFVQYLAPFASGAFGIGVAWQGMRGQLKSLRCRAEELVNRIEKVERKLEIRGVPYRDLEKRCGECHRQYAESLKMTRDTFEADRREVNSRLDKLIDLLVDSMRGREVDQRSSKAG